MHIEINAGGLGGFSTASVMQLNMSEFISDTDHVISSFKAVKQKVHELPGGIGRLQDASNEIEARIQVETKKVEEAKAVQTKAGNFLQLADRVDRSVANLVNVNKEQFFQNYPHMRPVSDRDERHWWEKAWDYLCDTKDKIVAAGEKVLDFIADTAKKLWDSAVSFYLEHKKIIDTILVVAGAVTLIAGLIATGGLGMVGLLTALGVSAQAAASISIAVAVTAGVSAGVQALMEVADIWLEIDNPIFETVKKWAGVVSFVTNVAYNIGTLYDTIKKLRMPLAKSEYKDLSQLDKDQIQALKDYSGDDHYGTINKYLRGSDTIDSDNKALLDKLHSTLDHASLPDDQILYRGTDMIELGDLDKLPIDEWAGKVVQEPSFLSSSQNLHTAEGFASFNHKPVVIEIVAPKGSHGLSIADISEFPNEAEVLFDCGHELLITGAEQRGKFLHVFAILHKGG